MECHCAFPEFLGGVGLWLGGCKAGWNFRGIVEVRGDCFEVLRSDAGEDGGHDVGALGGVVRQFGKEVAAEVKGGAGNGDGGVWVADVEDYGGWPGWVVS